MSELNPHKSPGTSKLLSCVALGCAVISLIAAIAMGVSANSIRKDLSQRLDQLEQANGQLQAQIQMLQGQQSEAPQPPEIVEEPELTYDDALICELLPEAARLSDGTLILPEVFLRVMLPEAQEELPFDAELTLMLNGEEIADAPEEGALPFEPSEAVGTYELQTDLTFRLSRSLEEGDVLELCFTVTPEGMNPGFCFVTWEFLDGELQMTAG